MRLPAVPLLGDHHLLLQQLHHRCRLSLPPTAFAKKNLFTPARSNTGQVASIGAGGSQLVCRVVTAILLTLSILYYALVNTADTMTLAQIFMLLGSVATVCIVIWARIQFRKRYGIEGSNGFDFFAGLCCACCSVAQILNTVRDGVYEGFWDGYDKLRTSEPLATVPEDASTDVESGGASDNSAASSGASSTASTFSFRSIV